MEDEVLGLGWVLVPFPGDTDWEMEIAWRKFIAEGTQDHHIWVQNGWVGWRKQYWAEGDLNSDEQRSCHRDSTNPIGSFGIRIALQNCPALWEVAGPLCPAYCQGI